MLDKLINPILNTQLCFTLSIAICQIYLKTLLQILKRRENPDSEAKSAWFGQGGAHHLSGLAHCQRRQGVEGTMHHGIAVKQDQTWLFIV